MTLNTGHRRRSPRSEVDDGALEMVADLLARALAGERPSIPAVPLACTCSATGEGRCLLVTVWGPPIEGHEVPIVTIGVAGHSRCGGPLWRMLHDQVVAVALATDRARVPPEPWCAARIEVGASLYLDAMHWLGDFERCLAWAWLGRGRSGG